ncbi:hypothetical protein CDAR_620991 [Caerostris darwini]|uniref:Uncharacterized protein n=1 Tax=Caerostris darwini TaxID=1538125 RepID=A0AAV4T603_9ARAC|nr:hypothetical protein CDAR_620991 [Caerostris darwini]
MSGPCNHCGGNKPTFEHDSFAKLMRLNGFKMDIKQSRRVTNKWFFREEIVEEEIKKNGPRFKRHSLSDQFSGKHLKDSQFFPCQRHSFSNGSVVGTEIYFGCFVQRLKS